MLNGFACSRSIPRTQTALLPGSPIIVNRVRGNFGQAKARGRRQFAATLHVANSVDVTKVRVHIARGRDGGRRANQTDQRDD
jgi:hypothetical protein